MSDEEVLMAAGRLMVVLGPSQLRLADIAREAGVTAGALVQRFGSKRELLLTLVTAWAGSVGEMFSKLRASCDSPLEAMAKYVDGMAQMGEGPGGVAHHLGWLQLDLGDPDFHVHAQRGARATRRELEKLAAEAALRGELKRSVDSAAVARAVEVTVGGSLLAWAFHQEGDVRDFVRRDLGSVLAPYLTASGRRILSG